jgi:hypothetical protein
LALAPLFFDLRCFASWDTNVGLRYAYPTYMSSESVGMGAIKSGGKTLPSKARTQNLCAHFQTRHCEGVSTVAIQTAFSLALSFQKTELPPGSPRCYVPRNDKVGVRAQVSLHF